MDALTLVPFIDAKRAAADQLLAATSPDARYRAALDYGIACRQLDEARGAEALQDRPGGDQVNALRRRGRPRRPSRGW